MYLAFNNQPWAGHLAQKNAAGDVPLVDEPTFIEPLSTTFQLHQHALVTRRSEVGYNEPVEAARINMVHAHKSVELCDVNYLIDKNRKRFRRPFQPYTRDGPGSRLLTSKMVCVHILNTNA
jgi:hypothetical protein